MLAEAGATVVVNDIDGAKAEETLALLPPADGRPHQALTADVAVSAQVDAMFARVLGLVRSLALEVSSRGIRVNAVCPGSIDTPMMRGVPAEMMAGPEAKIPLGKVGRSYDIAAAISYLLSDDAAYITGATSPVNGGLFIG